MAATQHKTIVGFFALTGIILLGVLILMFGGGRSFFTKTYKVHVKFPQGVVGVAADQSVTLNGKRIGQTKAIEFWDPSNLEAGIRVVLAIEEKYELPASAEVKVGTSIMGFGRPSILVVVDPSAKGKLKRDGTAVVPGTMIPMLDQIMPPEMQSMLTDTASGILELADRLKPVADNLAKLIAPRHAESVDLACATANLATVVERFDLALKNINQIIGDEDNQANLKTLLVNIRTISEEGLLVVSEVRGFTTDGREVARETKRLIAKLTESLDQMSSLLQKADTVVAALGSTDGSAGSFLNDNRLYEELVLSARRLSKALDEVRELLDIAKKGDFEFKPKVF